MAIKIIPDNCFFKVYDACDVGGVPMVYIPVYKKSMNLASVGSGFILPRETPIGPIYLSTIAHGDIKQTRSVSGHYAILELTTGEDTYYIAYIDGVNYGWIADPKAFTTKMKAYQLPRKSGTMKIKKVTIWGEEDHHWEFRCIGEPTNDMGDAYEGFLNGVSQGVKLLVTWQKMLLSNYNPFSI